MDYFENLEAHNERIRYLPFRQIVNGENIDKSWDFGIEIQIIYIFLEKFPEVKLDKDDLLRSISFFSKRISFFCQQENPLVQPTIYVSHVEQ